MGWRCVIASPRRLVLIWPLFVRFYLHAGSQRPDMTEAPSARDLRFYRTANDSCVQEW